jgi:hypothetical protein
MFFPFLPPPFPPHTSFYPGSPLWLASFLGHPSTKLPCDQQRDSHSKHKLRDHAFRTAATSAVDGRLHSHKPTGLRGSSRDHSKRRRATRTSSPHPSPSWYRHGLRGSHLPLARVPIVVCNRCPARRQWRLAFSTDVPRVQSHSTVGADRYFAAGRALRRPQHLDSSALQRSALPARAWLCTHKPTGRARFESRQQFVATGDAHHSLYYLLLGTDSGLRGSHLPHARACADSLCATAAGCCVRRQWRLAFSTDVSCSQPQHCRR